MNKGSVAQASAYDDEIDLFELFASLWEEKWLIVASTVIIGALATAYALVATPVYQATVVVNSPPASAVQAYNLGRKELELEEISVEGVYGGFISTLTSGQLRNEFFDEVVWPSYKGNANKNAALNQFRSALSIKQSNPKGNKSLYEVTFELADAELAAEWANQYVQKASVMGKAELKNNIETELADYQRFISLEIDKLVYQASLQRQSEITRLTEALAIAEAAGLQEPILPTVVITHEGGNDNLLFMRGAKILTSQVTALEARASDESFIPELGELKARKKLLEAIKVNDSSTQLVRIDEEAMAPTSPIKPKKMLIVAVGIVLGGMLGVFAALIRSMIRKRRLQTA